MATLPPLRLNQLASKTGQTAWIATGTLVQPLGSAMTRQQPASRRTTILCGLFAIAMGLFLLLVGLGVVPLDPRSVHAPMWTASAAGIAFMLAGLSVLSAPSRVCPKPENCRTTPAGGCACSIP